MVGFFSKFSSSKSGHRRTQSAIDAREVSAPIPEDTVAEVAQPLAHGIDVGVEFKPVEHPVEPLDNDKPVQCPLPEPSILNLSKPTKMAIATGSSSLLKTLLNPKKNVLAAMHKSSVDHRLRKYVHWINCHFGWYSIGCLGISVTTLQLIELEQYPTGPRIASLMLYSSDADYWLLSDGDVSITDMWRTDYPFTFFYLRFILLYKK
ncbi:uncharacterized protein LOC110717324 [Chenopodium quinoa]|uniref:uncharacterized protein LOC110692236 n=1 Tax=Chenopodium quinoa TaxID=63459 RepID=UPI000B77ACFF|nr:uncharacterized protein LOC110692236 [Chenopodium quinoa]XP_021751677.1 uncharacterized protein LOC110717324 [Chenopodium quinoa]